MTKAILFDLDGVVLVGREEYFSARYAREHGVPMEEVSEFFTGQFKKCSFGQCDLKEEILPYLSKWKWPGTVDGFIQEWFSSESTVDKRVLDIIDTLRKSGRKCYIASRQEKYRMQYLWDQVGLSRHFDGTFCTADVGFDKSEREYWDCVLSALNLPPEEIAFLDDTQKNIEMARSLGIRAQFYDGIHVLEEEVRKLGIEAA